MKRFFSICVFLLISNSYFSQDVNLVDKNGLKQGFWQKKYENGFIRYEGNFKDDIENQNIFVSGILNNNEENIKWEIKKI